MAGGWWTRFTRPLSIDLWPAGRGAHVNSGIAYLYGWKRRADGLPSIQGRSGTSVQTWDWGSTMERETNDVPVGRGAVTAGRRSALRALSLASIGALASLRLTGEAEAKKQTREQRRRVRQQRRAQAEKKKGGKLGPTGPAGPPEASAPPRGQPRSRQRRGGENGRRDGRAGYRAGWSGLYPMLVRWLSR